MYPPNRPDQIAPVHPHLDPATFIYESVYGLREKPFSLASDPRFLYKSGSHALAFGELLTAIRRREGLIVLTGDMGTGKTTLCRAVLEQLDQKTLTTFVPDPFASREDLLKMLLIDFGVMSVDDLKSGRLKDTARPDLSYPLYDFLRSLQPLHAFAVLIIDEAQNLSIPLLEEIRILSDLEDREKLLQVVLVGQLELRANLKLPQMCQVDQRVSVRCELGPLPRDELSGYVAHRLQVAGGSPDRVQFSDAALDEVYGVSSGVPRIVNLICDRALQHGHREWAAYIEPRLIARAAEDLGLSTPAALAPLVISSTVAVDEVGEAVEVDESAVAAAPVVPPTPKQVHLGDDETTVETDLAREQTATTALADAQRETPIESRASADPPDAATRVERARGEPGSQAEPAPVPSTRPTVRDTPPPYPSPTRHAHRVRMPEAVKVVVDRSVALLVDLSSCGAQILSPKPLRPNDAVRMMVPREEGVLSCQGRIVWAMFELSRAGGTALYRAGVQFTEVDTRAVHAFMVQYGRDATTASDDQVVDAENAPTATTGLQSSS